MKIILLTLVCVGLIAGCKNTADGIQKDSESNGQKAAEQTQDAVSGASQTAKDLEAAAMLTPKVKLAISADKLLNDPTNLINVNSSEERVTLEGHVTSVALKNLAGEIGAKVLKENSANQS
ncbi:MAG: hypothetical protein ABL962_09360, partial [Fimbriimonadaceae bacterium]